MAAISLCEKYKFSYLHPQMNGVWTEYVDCAPHPPDASFTAIFLVIGVPCIRKKLLTEKNIAMNFISLFMLTPFFHRYPTDDVSCISRA